MISYASPLNKEAGLSKAVAVIAAFEEEKNIGAVIDGIKPYVHEVIVVCDSENDPTLKTAKGHGAVTLHNTFGRGKGCAIRYAIQHVAADIFIFIDADGSHRASDAPFLISPIVENRADMVVGSRLIKGAGSEELSGSAAHRIHWFGNKIGAFLTALFTGRSVADSNNGFRAIRASDARDLGLSEKRFAIETEMFLKCASKKKRVMEVPTFEYKRKSGSSRLNEWVQFVDCFRCYLKNIL